MVGWLVVARNLLSSTGLRKLRLHTVGRFASNDSHLIHVFRSVVDRLRLANTRLSELCNRTCEIMLHLTSCELATSSVKRVHANPSE